MTVAVNKCNISTYALNSLKSLLWLIKCKNYDKAILENYAQYLDCKEVQIDVCYPDKPCTAQTAIDFTCTFEISGIYSVAGAGSSIRFGIIFPDLTAIPVLHDYVWEYDTTVFNLAAGHTVNEAILYLEVKAGIDASTLVAFIRVTAKDINDCIDTKECFYTPQGMDCSGTGLYCSNPTALTVT